MFGDCGGVAEDVRRGQASRLGQDAQDGGDHFAALPLPHEVDKVDEVLLDEGVARIEGPLAQLFLEFLPMAPVVLTQLFRLLPQPLSKMFQLFQFFLRRHNRIVIQFSSFHPCQVCAPFRTVLVQHAVLDYLVDAFVEFLQLG